MAESSALPAAHASFAAEADDDLAAAIALSLEPQTLFERMADTVDAVEKLALLARILRNASRDPERCGSINLASANAARLLCANARALLQHPGFAPQSGRLVLMTEADPSQLVGFAALVDDALVVTRAKAATDPLIDESVSEKLDDDEEEMRAALALSLGEADPRTAEQQRKRQRVAPPARPPANALRRGQDFMFRTWSAFDVSLLGPQTLQELQRIMTTLTSPGFPWVDATFDGLTDNYVETGWDFEPGERTPPPPELRCIGTLVNALIDQLAIFHPGDLVVPMRCFVNLYRNGGNSVPAHVHHCRQLTMSLGAMRVFTARGPGGFPRELARHVDAVLPLPSVSRAGENAKAFTPRTPTDGKDKSV